MAPQQDGMPAPQRYLALTGLWLAMAMTVIDSSVANIALPSMGREMAVSPATTTWVITTYQIAILMTLLSFSSLGEWLGYRRVYLGGLCVFTLMSLGCALAWNFPALATFRFFQGLGAAAVMSLNGALIRFIWPRQLLAKGLGYNVVVVSCAAAGGPVLASFVLSIADWPWLFLINIPVGLVAWLLIRRHTPHAGAQSDSFDATGALLNAAMFGALFLAASEGVHGRTSPLLWIGVVAAGLAGGWQLLRSRTQARPLFPLDLIANPRLRLAYGGSICAFTAQMCLLVSMPFLLEGEMGLHVALVGPLLLPLPFGLAATSPLSGHLADSKWAGWMSAGGMVLLASMLILLALSLPHKPPLVLVALAMGVCGVGFSLFQVPNNNVMLRTGPIDRAGSAAGMLAVCRLTGQTAGALIAALAFRLVGPESTAALAAAAGLALCAALLASRR